MKPVFKTNALILILFICLGIIMSTTIHSSAEILSVTAIIKLKNVTIDTTGKQTTTHKSNATTTDTTHQTTHPSIVVPAQKNTTSSKTVISKSSDTTSDTTQRPTHPSKAQPSKKVIKSPK